MRELDLSRDQDGKDRPAQESDNASGEGRARSLSGAESGGTKKNENLPCRLNVSLQGVEWFVYNRSAAYDAVILGMTQDIDEGSENVDGGQTSTDSPESKVRRRANQSAKRSRKPSLDLEKDPSAASVTQKTSHGSSSDEPKLRDFSATMQTEGSSDDAPSKPSTEDSYILRFLPIHIDCQKAAVVLGNEHTKSVLITKAERISGEIDATKSLNPIDHYKQLFNFDFEHPVVQIKPNDDYKEDQTTAATRIKRGMEQPEEQTPHFYNHSFWHRQRRHAWHKLQDLIPMFRSSVESFSSTMDDRPDANGFSLPGSGHWQGLSRYLDEGEQDDRARWSAIEYATVTTIADCPKASMSFYWDVVGTVQEKPSHAKVNRKKEALNVNGDIAPEWGISLSLEGAIVNYGPWADRQRADIQRVFFPSLCKDTVPSMPLLPGQSRVPTEFKVYIELDEETILRVPIREESKNWKWAKHVDTMGPQNSQKKRSRNRRGKADKGNTGVETRPFGWLDLKIGSNATVSYVMDMMAGESGYANNVQLDLPSIEITTSVNHGLLLRSSKSSISCDLSNPLQWNGHHDWIFDVKSNGVELFILREHVFLFIDLVDDWAGGPPQEYLTFSPFKYVANLHLTDFEIFLNVNDANIINNPSDFDDNTFVSIFGEVLNAKIDMPLTHYRPHRTDISFDVDAHTGGLKLHVPPWNTQATFLSSNIIATLNDLLIDGTYQYCSTTSPANTDTLLLNVHGNSPTAYLYGFVIRYYLKVKDNYFGDDIRFKTLEEYQDVLRAKREGVDDLPAQPPHKKSNDLDVVLCVTADDTNAILPANLYSSKNHVRIEIANLAADLRFTNYYMDLDVVFKTLAFSLGSEADGTTTPVSATSSTQLFIDGINICGNRLFGLPPMEPTYICNWDFSVGAVSGECTTEFFGRLASGGRALGFSFDDDENALPLIMEAILNDVTFLRAYVESVRVWMHVEEAAFLFSTGDIAVNFNDWAGSHYSQKLNLKIPDLQIACVDAESASRHRSRAQQPVETHALVQTTVSLVMIKRKLGFTKERLLQQEHLKRHDQRTHRSDFLLHPHLLDDSMLVPVDPPAMSIPLMPIPILMGSDKASENGSMISGQVSSIRQKRTVGRKSSFLSMSAASQKSDGSVVRPRSPKRSPNKSGDAMFVDSRSRSVQNGSRLGHRIPLRDVSVSTGRHSAFYSAVGEERGLPPSSVTFSSSYIEPYFPLEGVEPDPRDLPSITVDDKNTSVDENNQMTLDDIHTSRIGEDTEHVSFILELPSGVRGVFNSQAVDAIAGLLTALQHIDPADILDDLQIESMNEIFKLNSQKKQTNNVTDFKLHTPGISLRFLNASDPHGDGSSSNASDQYDLSITDLAVTTRSDTKATNESSIPDVENASALHLLLGSVGFAAKERYNDLDDPQAAIDAVIQDVVFWMSSGKEKSLNLRFSDLQVTTASSKIEYLASLLHRSKFVASNVAETFSSRVKQQSIRIQLFTYLVVTLGQKTPDPLFLTRPSYVLRSADNHLRTSDSWKVITRLHHMYTNLDPNTQQDITLRCLDNVESLPGDAKKGVLAGFNEWRSWDLNNVHKCLVMERVYGSSKKLSITIPEKAVPTRFTFSTRGIRLILDPGPKQNEISISAMSATADSNTKRKEDGDSQVATALIQSTVVQLICSDVSINLNWELCELANDILKLYHQIEQKPEMPLSSSSIQEKDPMATQHDLQIIVTTDSGSITIDTINLRAIMISDGMKGSFVTIANGNGDALRTSSLLIAARAATTKLISHSQELTLYQLRQPSIFAGHESVLVGTTHGNVFKLAANCQQLSFTVCQEILALLEVVDLVVGDEVEQIYQLMKRIPKNNRSQESAPPQKHQLPPFTKINVALFLDMYRIKVPLLRSLTYEVSGVVARGSIAAQLGSEIVFDFDVKQTMHDMRTVGEASNDSISSIYIPPTNGRITTHMSQEETSVTVFTSVELIELDAAAIHGLVSALNRPEMTSVLSDIQDDIKEIQAHIEDVFGNEDKPFTRPSTPNRKSPFVYDVHLTLAGLNIYADAQKDSQGHSTAKLEFKMGCVQLVLANRLEQQGPILNYPELRVDVRQIMFELARWNEGAMEPCGNLYFAAFLHATSKLNESGNEVRSFHLKSNGLEINLFADTASSVVDIIGYLQEKIKNLDFSREKKYLSKLRKSRPRIAVSEYGSDNGDNLSTSTILFASMYSLELLNIQVSWIVGTYEHERVSKVEPENLVLSLKQIDLSTRKENSARLAITDLQLQMVPASYDKTQRSYNSALLPEVVFNVGYVSTTDARRLIFQAAGKSLDLRLTSQFIIPAAELQKSINSAAKKVRAASETWTTPSVEKPIDTTKRKPFFGKKRMESLLVDADFAGAVVYLTGKKPTDAQGSGRLPQAGRYGQFSNNDTSNHTTLQAPGLAWKVEYKDNGVLEPSLNAEVKVDGSKNILYPTVVPLIMDIMSAVKEMVSDEEGDKKTAEQKASPQKFFNVEEENILAADPSTVLGRTRLNLGLRICRQEFSLSCHPIARVSATAKFEDIYMTVNTVRSAEHGHFFAATAAFTNLQVSVQHVYSRDATASFDVNSVFLSLMNSKHVSGTSGLSAILKISPMKVQVNAKQLQDFLLFREIWVPPEIRQGGLPNAPTIPALHNQTILVQRYQQVAATGAFPWNATISIVELDVQLDLGQAIGKSVFIISNFWISSKKNSDWEQNLCLGFDKIGVDSTGRMSGFVALQNFKLRTSIQWPAREMALNQTPLVQASLAFSQFRVKAAFDYQAFLVADVTSFEFLMYNVRNQQKGRGDRLVAILDGDAVQLFCTTTSAAQALAVYQAFQRLILEKRANYESSLQEIEKFTKRKSVSHPHPSPLPKTPTNPLDEDKRSKSPISLHTDVIVTLKAVNIGAFPNSFSDHQVFKLEALNAQARFAVIMNAGKIHSILGLTLGQLRIGLAAVRKVQAPRSVDEISVEDVVNSATGSRGGTILKVPKVEAVMQTWQVPNSNKIDYIFKSSFEGKVEVGWNYSRISYIRNMWAAHTKALALKLGKPLPQSAVKLTGVPGEEESIEGESQKITAEVNMPASKYEYTALEEPVIEAPQLRDMGEATPP